MLLIFLSPLHLDHEVLPSIIFLCLSQSLQFARKPTDIIKTITPVVFSRYTVPSYGGSTLSSVALQRELSSLIISCRNRVGGKERESQQRFSVHFQHNGTIWRLFLSLSKYLLRKLPTFGCLRMFVFSLPAHFVSWANQKPARSKEGGQATCRHVTFSNPSPLSELLRAGLRSSSRRRFVGRRQD